MAKIKEVKKKFDDTSTSFSTNSDLNKNKALENYEPSSSEWSDAVEWAKNLIEEFDKKEESKLIGLKNKVSKKENDTINENHNEFDDIKFKNALSHLVNSEIKYRLIIENVNDLIFILNKYFKFDFLNQSVNQKLLGYRNDELIGEYLDEFIHHDDLKNAINLVEESWKNKESKGEIRFKRKNGTYIWLELKGTVFFDLDGEEKILLIGRDITERKNNDYIIRGAKEKIWRMFNI